MPWLFHCSPRGCRNSIKQSGLVPSGARHGPPYVYCVFTQGQAERIGWYWYFLQGYDVWGFWVQNVPNNLVDRHPPWAGLTAFREVLWQAVHPDDLRLLKTWPGVPSLCITNWVSCFLQAKVGILTAVGWTAFRVCTA